MGVKSISKYLYENNFLVHDNQFSLQNYKNMVLNTCVSYYD